jgi:aspartate kinase
MGLYVMKFGGTSVATPELIKRVARRAISYKRQGDDVVIVLSAMGDTTDELENLAAKITDNPDEREMAVLMITGERISAALCAMALNDMGQPARSFTGWQAGFRTDDGSPLRSKIAEVSPDRIRAALDSGDVAVVTGYQGLNEDGDETALGRGGSDLTAVALACALRADACEIYTDVDGIYTADPRVVPDARKIAEISSEEMLELASSGARVMQARSVEYAKKHGTVIHVRSSFSEGTGTLIREADPMMEAVIVRGIAHDMTDAKITLRGVPDRPGIAACVFKQICEDGVNVDMIVQNVSQDGFTDLSFTVPVPDVRKTMNACLVLQREIGAREILADEDIAKISVVGIGMRSHTGVAAQMFEVLASNDINIEMISTSEIKISCIVKEDMAEKAVRVLHDAFQLNMEGNGTVAG